jgi:branched-chain amino acid transport system substrate-binding protein
MFLVRKTTTAYVRRALPAAAVAVLLGMGMTACGSSDDKKASGGTTTPAGDSALGTPNAAKGAPIKLGFVASGQTPAIDTTDEIRGAEAVVKYANAYLGGLNGRPIELQTCQEKNTPAGAADCAQQFISGKVAGVVNGSTGQLGAVIKAVSAGGLPTFTNLGSDPLALSDPNSLVFGNPLAVFGSPAAFARDSGIKKAALLVIDVPGASGPAKQLGPVFFKNAGADLDVVPIAPGTVDMTPQVQAALSKGAKMFHIIGDPTFCTSALKAIKTLGSDAKVSVIDRCVDTTGAATIPGGYEGVTIVSQANYGATTPEFKLYQAVMKNDSLTPSGNTASGYSGMLSLVRAANAAKITDYTPAGLLAAVKSAPATPFPNGDCATMKCDGSAIPGISKNICSTFGVVGTANKDGSVTTYKTLDATGIYKLG